MIFHFVSWKYKISITAISLDDYHFKLRNLTPLHVRSVADLDGSI